MNAAGSRASTSLRIALGEYDVGWHDPAASLSRASALIGRAATAGAQLVVLPEMCPTGFTLEAARYAEAVDGPSATAIGIAARNARVHVVAGIATRAALDGVEVFYNSAILFGPDGSRLAEYRKQRLFAFATEHEIYTAGTEPVVVEVAGVRVALFICFDLRFPELFRAVAPSIDCIVLIASWPTARQNHWDTLLRARSIESQAYVIGVNRVGRGGDSNYAGGSAAYGPWGEALQGSGDPVIVTIDPAHVASARKKFPFVLSSVRSD